MIQRNLLFIFFSLFGFCQLRAGDGEYAVILIKPDLSKNAHAVVRYDDVSIEIKSANNVVIKSKWVITVLDSEGDENAQLSEYYDQFTQINSIDGALYDAAGKKIKSVKRSDISDESAVSSMSLMEDSRVKRHHFAYKSYPYTVMYEVETRSTESMFLPRWNPLGGLFVGVEQSSYSVTTDPNYALRYKEYNGAGAPAITTENNKKIYRWQIRNLKALTNIFASPGMRSIVPMIYIGASDFAIDDFQGKMTDWNQYGASMYKLVNGRDQLPTATKLKVHQLADGISDRREKIKTLYEYMQSTTRYISIQLGIGGWQPFDANYVATKGYGDCKALSNYMFSLLKEAGIRSHYALITAGSWADDMIPDFANAHFNHAILCVPMEKDSVWLECTSQTESAGYMGKFTGNRHALLITENGGFMVSTPPYDFTKNTQTRVVKARVDVEGNINLVENSTYQAIKQEDIYLHYWSADDKVKYVQSKFDLPTYTATKFSFEEKKGSLPVILESMEIVSTNYASLTGKRIFLIPNLLTRSKTKLAVDEERKFDLKMPPGFTEIDSVEIEIPAGYLSETIPAEVNIDSRFGNYHSISLLQGNKIFYYRRFISQGGYFKASEYAELAKFLNEVYNRDREKIVLTRKE